MWVVGYEMWEQQPGSSKIRHRRKILKPVSIRKLLPVILSEAKNLCGPINYEILRRLAPQNDTHKRGFRMSIK